MSLEAKDFDNFFTQVRDFSKKYLNALDQDNFKGIIDNAEEAKRDWEKLKTSIIIGDFESKLSNCKSFLETLSIAYATKQGQERKKNILAQVESFCERLKKEISVQMVRESKKLKQNSAHVLMQIRQVDQKNRSCCFPTFLACNL